MAVRAALAVLALGALAHAAPRLRRPALGVAKPGMTETFGSNTPTSANCTLKWVTQRLDHLSSADVPRTSDGTFQQRVFYYDGYWSDLGDGVRGPIFFYTGNEADVTLYINSSGLMWENAKEFGALLVWAEHRFFGETQPFKDVDDLSVKHLAYLSVEQALADYASLLFNIRQTLPGAADSPVVAFGGSYGGMLASWFRMKYPSAVVGAIAASAPIWAFEGEDPPVDPYGFNAVATRDATPAAGAAEACVDNTRAVWGWLDALGTSDDGLQTIGEAMSLCSAPTSSAEVTTLKYWIETAWVYEAMGDYPYSSSYLLNGDGMLPPYPVAASCEYLKDPTLAKRPKALLEGMAGAVGVYYNNSGTLECFDFDAFVNEQSQIDDTLWNWLYCTEMIMPSGSNGETDMFFKEPWVLAATVAGCKAEFGVNSRVMWPTITWGGHRGTDQASNIIFSNGDLDPWSANGVTSSQSDTVYPLMIEGGAHHLDLMFSNEADPVSVKEARKFEMEQAAAWITEGYALNGITWSLA